MSAFVVENDHIDALLTAAMAYGEGGRFTFYRIDPDKSVHKYDLDLGTADLIGGLLSLENQRSVNHRYDASEIEPFYTFKGLHWKHGNKPDPVVVLKLVNCYTYQTCEHDEWRTSTAKAFCDGLTDKMIRSLPGYDDAPWAIGADRRNIFA